MRRPGSAAALYVWLQRMPRARASSARTIGRTTAVLTASHNAGFTGMFPHQDGVQEVALGAAHAAAGRRAYA